MNCYGRWLTIAAFVLGLNADRSEDEISNIPLDYNGSTRTDCPAGAAVGYQPADRFDSSMRLRQLRSEMVRITSVQGPPLDGYIVTSHDEHQSKSVAAHDERRAFLTGFTGNAGEAVVTLNKAALWTDSRYHLQADRQLDCNWILMAEGQKNVPSIGEWLKQEFLTRSEVLIGADPTLIPAYTWQRWETALANTSVKLVAVRDNLVDVIWQVDRPGYNTYGAYAFSIKYAGEPWQDKVDKVRSSMKVNGADGLVVNALDEIAWLFNIRGYDLPHAPVVRSYVIVAHDGIHMYAQRNKLMQTVRTHLRMDGCYSADCVKLHNYTDFADDLRSMSQAWSSVWLPVPCEPSEGASRKIYTSIPIEKRLARASPIINLRAGKNAIEADGMRKSHLRDGTAMCEFLAYMERQMRLDSAGWDELQVIRVVNEFRLEQNLSQGIAFSTIAAYGAHGALPHYEPSVSSNVAIGTDSTLLVNSGGQYLDGTTDVTRTLHFGEPTHEQKQAYTRVLIGSIQLASLTFPRYLKTDQLDVMARQPFWNVGFDYNHSTGHGIGHFSLAHEAPVRINYADVSTIDEGCNSAHLEPGYFFSNEPGYYKTGDFGVRLGNVLEVVEAETRSDFLMLNDVTRVPYEPKLIDFDMLSPDHRRWFNNYNRRIREEVGRELKRTLRMKTFDWMMKKTRTVPEHGDVDETMFRVTPAGSSIFEHSQ